MNRPTIAAISTPLGYGGIGIVKISGPESLRIARGIFRSHASKKRSGKSATTDTEHLESHHLTYGEIVRPGDRGRVDEVLLSVMRAPHSYTGEDVVEINAHAGPVVLNTILETVLEQGAVLAEPGEFTRRAFLNGRLDLTQAEAVMELINAKTKASADMASAQLAGHMRTEIEQVRERVLGLIAANEATIDFPEEVESSEGREAWLKQIQREIIAPLDSILKRSREGRIFREGLRLAVVGRPNVGKSSLMNRLVRKEKAIVTNIPGTTRDAVEDFISIQGVPVIIVDTAGLQNTENPVEIIGIQKTHKNIEGADLILFVVEEGCGIQAEDELIFQKIEKKSAIIVINKIDLKETGDACRIPTHWKRFKQIQISALKGEGIDRLESEIHRCVAGGEVDTGGQYAPGVRHSALLDKSLQAARGAVKSREQNDPAELTAIELGDCLKGLDDILGKTLKEDVLGRIFSEFCIGK